MIWANPLRLKQIFLNLLSNAIKYNRDGGTITISLTSLPGAKIRLGIADTGPGIPDHLLEQIFEPFNRLSAEQAGIPGTGIGLTVSRQLVRLMAGQLFVTSKLNEGTTFWMEFNCTAAGKILASSTKI
jgi:signal transduction histidine kinase